MIPVVLAVVVMATLLVPQPAGADPPHTRTTKGIAPIVVRTGRGYAIVVDAITLEASMVLDRQNSNALLWVLASDGCTIDCVRWLLVSQAYRVPRQYTACMGIWPHWCRTFHDIRKNFVHDATYRNDLYRAVVRANYIYGDCVTWGFWTNRYWDHTSDGCKDVRR